MTFLRRSSLIFCFWSAFCATGALAKEKPWIEIRSPHFRLITNGDEHDARRVLGQFEVMRTVFDSQFPHLKLDAPAPLLILAPKDESTAKELLPQFWAHSGPKPAGVYHHGWEREYAVVRPDTIDSDPDAYHIIYHEYVHSLLHINLRWLPQWLDEGLAEFYGYTAFDSKKAYLGSPPDPGRVRFLQSRPPIPLEQFISSAMYSRDEERTQLFYMQAWALTHFLMFGNGMEHGRRLAKFVTALERGVEQKKAFEETIGDLHQVHKQYEVYSHMLAFTAEVLPAPAALNEKDFPVRAMSAAETQAEMAAWHIGFHHWDQVREFTQAALQNDPKLPLAHEDMGFLLFNEGKDDEAFQEFSSAVDLDEKDYIALFAKIMTSPASRSSNPQDQRATYLGLSRVIEVKPDYAPAYVELAKQSVAQGRLDIALGLSRRAEQLEPFRAGYHILTGEILRLMSRPEEAAAQAAYVADRWPGADRDEAMELWNRIPAASRQVPAPEPPAGEDKRLVAEGKIQSVNCNGTDFAITLEVGGHPETFKSKGFPVGFSDTLWVGRDHFSPCFHVQGLRAMVRYNPPKNNSYAGDLSYAGFRDDLAPPTVTTEAIAK